MAAMLLLVGCSQAAPPAEERQKGEGPERIGEAPTREPSPDPPAYDITSERDCADAGVVGKCFKVSTDATSREESGPVPPGPPAYGISAGRDCAEAGGVGECFKVATDATSREELGLVTADLRLGSPGYLAVIVTFYPSRPTAGVSAVGFAFENEQAARVVLAQFLAQGPGGAAGVGG